MTLAPAQMNLLLKYAGAVLAAGGISYVLASTVFGDTIFTRYYHRYIAYLDRNLRLIFLAGSPVKIVIGQAVALLLVPALAMAVQEPLVYLCVPLPLIGPALYLRQKRTAHIKKLEDQVDTFIMGLANSLKTVPSPAAALAAVVTILPSPTRLEIDRVLKEMRIGSTLEQSILNMATRLRSPAMDSALSALLIGLQIGGNLPAVLENTAATIREMNRLEGVVRTKTAEGKAQLWVLALFPLGICFAFSQVQEGYFDPLQKTVVGYMVTTVAVILWISSLMIARKILRVDI
jgi:tight adherence protein B